MPIGQIKEVKIDGKTFELKKQGINTSLTLQSLFTELVIKTGMIDSSEDIPDSQMHTRLMIGMRGNVLNEVQSVIVGCVSSPQLNTSEVWESLEFETVPALFYAIYKFQVGIPEKKSEAPLSTSNTPKKDNDSER